MRVWSGGGTIAWMTSMTVGASSPPSRQAANHPSHQWTVGAPRITSQGRQRGTRGGRRVRTVALAQPPTLDRIYGEPVIDPPDIRARATSGEPTVDEIFDKYIQALGGSARLAALTSYAAKATRIAYGDVGKGDPAEIYAKAPNQFATI